jgi:hypothetical protein
VKHEDGYCDRCGCELDVVDGGQLTLDGLVVCAECARTAASPRLRDGVGRDNVGR